MSGGKKQLLPFNLPTDPRTHRMVLASLVVLNASLSLAGKGLLLQCVDLYKVLRELRFVLDNTDASRQQLSAWGAEHMRDKESIRSWDFLVRTAAELRGNHQKRERPTRGTGRTGDLRKLGGLTAG